MSDPLAGLARSHRHLNASWPVVGAVALAILLVATLGPASQCASGHGSSDDPGSLAQHLPMAFAPNVGQAPSSVLFEGELFGRSVLLTRSVIAVPGGSGLALIDTDPGVRAWPGGRLSGEAHYLLGDDPTQWHAHVPTYASVRYEGIYPGVDLQLAGDSAALALDFTFASSESVASVAWRPIGAPSWGALRVWRLGPFEAELGSWPSAALTGTVVWPTGWDTLGGSGHPEPLAASVVERPDGSLGLAVGPHPVSGALHVALELGYSTYLGGSRDDAGYKLAVDALGSAYVTGATKSGNFPTEKPIQDSVNGAFFDAFVTKLDTSGSALVYSTYLGGNQDDYGRDIALDADGRAYVVGLTASGNFPTVSPIQAKHGGGSDDAFVAVLSPEGSTLDFATYLGGRDSDRAYGVALGRAGAGSPPTIYVTGPTASSDFPTVRAAQGRAGGDSDAFVAAIAPSRTQLSYATYFGGAAGETSNAIAVDGQGTAYIVGYVTGPGLPLRNPYQAGPHGGDDAFIAAIDQSGSALSFSSYLGGNDTDEAMSLAVSETGEATVVGYTYSRTFPTANAIQTSIQGDTDAFVTRFAAGGRSLVFSTYLGGRVGDQGTDVALDADGSVYVAGTTNSTNFPTVDPVQRNLRGEEDAIVFVVASDGASLSFSTFLGGSGNDAGRGVALAPDGALVVTGLTDSADFPTSSGGYQQRYAGQGDAFVTRLGQAAPPTATVTVTQPPTATESTPPPASPTATSTEATATFAPATGTATPTSSPTATLAATATEEASPTPTPTTASAFRLFVPWAVVRE